MIKLRRINMYGGPGIGKTTTSCDIFSRLKNYVIKHSALPSLAQDNVLRNHVDIQVELVSEYVKSWAWEGRKPKGFDQFYICAQQMRREEIPLRNGVDVIVTDSPLLMQCAYAKKYNLPCWEGLVSCVEHFEKEYPSLNIFLDRGDRPYVAKGRYQNLEEAKEMDKYIKGMLDIYASGYSTFAYDKVHDIEKFVMSKIL